MIVCGTTASYIPYDDLKWILFTAGCVFYMFILFVSNDIFTKAIDRFGKQGSKGQAVVRRLYVISRIFFFSWTLYPIFFLLSSQGLCAVGEKWIALLHMIADLLAKNIFGILMWHTLWQRCKGNWQTEFPKGGGAKIWPRCRKGRQGRQWRPRQQRRQKATTSTTAT